MSDCTKPDSRVPCWIWRALSTAARVDCATATRPETPQLPPPLQSRLPGGQAMALAMMPPMGQEGTAVAPDRKSVGSGKSVSVRVDLGGRRFIKKIKPPHMHRAEHQT